MNEMATMGRNGDTKVQWDPADRASVDVARKAFDDAVGRRFLAFRKNADGVREQIRAFDPTAGKIFLVPPMAGG